MKLKDQVNEVIEYVLANNMVVHNPIKFIVDNSKDIATNKSVIEWIGVNLPMQLLTLRQYGIRYSYIKLAYLLQGGYDGTDDIKIAELVSENFPELFNNIVKKFKEVIDLNRANNGEDDSIHLPILVWKDSEIVKLNYKG